MDEHTQIARSVKHSSALVWHIAEISPGIFCLYDHKLEEQLITMHWDEVLAAYRNRPAYISHDPHYWDRDTDLILAAPVDLIGDGFKEALKPVDLFGGIVL